MNHLLDISIYDGLKLNINNNINDKLNIIYNEIPDNTFGIFITIQRNNPPINNNYKSNIHGCIGNWNNDFKILNKSEIIKYIKILSVRATWEDKRKENFNSIYKDSNTEYKITFLLNEIYEVDNNGYCNELNNYYDNNSNYGILVKDINNNKSTYLPQIFKEYKNWDYIKNTLLQISNIKSNSYQFYIYNTINHSKKIYKILENNIFDYIKENYINFINKYYIKNIPYTITNNKKIIYDNISDLEKITFINNILLFNIYLNDNIKNILNDNINNYKNKFLKNKKEFRHIGSFLLQILNKKEIKNDNNKYFSKIISTNLINSINWLDKKFEIYQVLISISHNLEPEYKQILINNRNLFLKNLINNNFVKEDIFKYNWESKYLFTLFTLSIETSNNIIKHSIILTKRILNILENLYENNNVETNYYMVGFESLCNLLILVNNTEIKNKLLDNIIYLYKLLIDRYDNNFGLFEYLDKSCKINITEHFINGIISLNYSINYINNISN